MQPKGEPRIISAGSRRIRPLWSRYFRAIAPRAEKKSRAGGGNSDGRRPDYRVWEARCRRGSIWRFPILHRPRLGRLSPQRRFFLLSASINGHANTIWREATDG